MDSEDVAGYCIILIFGLLLGCAGGCQIGQYQEQKQAVEAKAGHWECNPETGKTEFKYGCEDKK